MVQWWGINMKSYDVNVEGIMIPVQAESLKEAQKAVAEAVRADPSFLDTQRPKYEEHNARVATEGMTGTGKALLGVGDTMDSYISGAKGFAQAILTRNANNEGTAATKAAREERKSAFDAFDRQQIGVEDLGQNFDLVGVGGAAGKLAFKGAMSLRKSVSDGMLKMIGKAGGVAPNKMKKYLDNAKEIAQDVPIEELITKGTSAQGKASAQIMANTDDAQDAAEIMARLAKEEAMKEGRMRAQHEARKRIQAEMAARQAVPQGATPLPGTSASGLPRFKLGQ